MRSIIMRGSPITEILEFTAEVIDNTGSDDEKEVVINALIAEQQRRAQVNIIIFLECLFRVDKCLFSLSVDSFDIGVNCSRLLKQVQTFFEI